MEGTSSERQPCGIARRISFLLGVNAVVPESEGRPAYSRGVRLLRRMRNSDSDSSGDMNRPGRGMESRGGLRIEKA